jgi:putative transcriptional regulator
MTSSSLRGSLLVAAPILKDPNFRRTVVLLCEHGSEGAMGVVLNRPTAVPAGDAVPALSALIGPLDRVYEGGPVERTGIVALAEFSDPSASGAIAFDRIGLVSAGVGDLEEAITRVRLYAGYAGWGTGQLEAEVEEGAWILLEPIAADAFDEAPSSLWQRVLARQGGQLALLARMPDDPSVN